jgi:hypothetical protein
LGDENNIRRKISLNIPQYDQTLLNPSVMSGINVAPEYKYINDNNSIRDLMGDNNSEIDDINAKHNFYIRGTEHDGTSFKSLISLKDTDSVGDLLKKIGEAYGNTPEQDLVAVSVNEHGQIEIEDKLKGSSKLDFHMMASTSMSYDTSLLANNNNPALAADEFEVPTLYDNSVPPVALTPQISVDDLIILNGERYTVTNVDSTTAPVDTITVDRAITSSFTDVEVLKTTGLDLNDDLPASYEFNRHGVPIKDFVNSNYTQYTQLMNQEQDMFNPNKFTLSGDFIKKDGEVANKNTLLRDVLSSDVASIELTGRDSDGIALVAPNVFNIGATTTVDDLVKQIEATYDPVDSDVLTVSFEDGKIQIGKRDTFEFTTTQTAAVGQNIVNLGSSNQNYTPRIGDKIFFDGDPKPYTIGAIAGSTVTLNENLQQNIALNTKVTLNTVRADEFDIQLEAYSEIGGVGGTGVLINGLPSDSSSTYDEARFIKDTNKLISDVSQIIKLGAVDKDGNDIGNQFATDSTRLIDVAGTNTFSDIVALPVPIPPTVLSFSGINVLGNAFEVEINLRNDQQLVAQSSNPPFNDFQAKAYFSVTDLSVNPSVTTEYPIFDVEFIDNDFNGDFTAGDTEILTAGDNMTYKQLNDIINMVASDNLPTDTTVVDNAVDYNEYKSAIEKSQLTSTTSLDSKGRIVFEEKGVSSTKAEITLEQIKMHLILMQMLQL